MDGLSKIKYSGHFLCAGHLDECGALLYLERSV